MQFINIIFRCLYLAGDSILFHNCYWDFFIFVSVHDTVQDSKSTLLLDFFYRPHIVRIKCIIRCLLEKKYRKKMIDSLQHSPMRMVRTPASSAFVWMVRAQGFFLRDQDRKFRNFTSHATSPLAAECHGCVSLFSIVLTLTFPLALFSGVQLRQHSAQFNNQFAPREVFCHMTEFSF